MEKVGLLAAASAATAVAAAEDDDDNGSLSEAKIELVSVGRSQNSTANRAPLKL